MPRSRRTRALPRWQTGTVASGGEDIYYEVVEPATTPRPTVVLTHGAGGSPRGLVPAGGRAVAATYRVVTWDARGLRELVLPDRHARRRRVGRRPRGGARRDGYAGRAPRRPVDGRLVGDGVRARASRTRRARSCSRTRSAGCGPTALYEHFRRSTCATARADAARGRRSTRRWAPNRSATISPTRSCTSS